MTTLTECVWKIRLEQGEIYRANLGRRRVNVAHRVCVRLRCDVDTWTGDAVLQFDALLLAKSSGSGLLQEHALDARTIRAALDWAEYRPLAARAAGADDFQGID